MNVCTINHTATTPPWMSPEFIAMAQILSEVGYTANLLFGLPINGYVVWLIVRGRREKIASNFITLNQIVAEILLCLCSALYFPSVYLSISSTGKLANFLGFIFLCMRPLVQSYICLEQYLATVHPVLFLRCKPLRYKVACCCTAWLTVITFSLVGLALNFPIEMYVMMGALYLLFLLLMIFCCLSVLRVLRRPAPGEGPRDQHGANSMKKRAFKIIFVTLVYTLVSQLPVILLIFLVDSIPYHLFLTFSSVNNCLYVISGFVPSTLYLYRVEKLCCKCSCL